MISITADHENRVADVDRAVGEWNAALVSGDPGRIYLARRAALATIFTQIMDDDPRAASAGWRRTT